MATQQEVALAFFMGEDEPARASNFENVEVRGKRFLVGDGRAVYAKREPLRQITLWEGSLRVYIWDEEPRFSSDRLGAPHLRNQQRAVRRAYHHNREDILTVNQEVDSIPDGVPHVSYFPELDAVIDR